MLKYKDVNVHPIPGGWIVTKDIVYKDVRLVEGFFFNGANIPRVLWSLIPPNDPETLPGVAIHDKLCNDKNFSKADDYLEEILIESKVKMWKRKAIVVGVRFYTSWIR